MAITPMMQQYLQIKEKNPDMLLFFRLGDFYELFFDDAHTASRELDLTLTGKDCGLSERAPMCGIPYHAVNTYVARLIEKGYKIAICDQLTDPAESKGLVERDITRIITPGTVIESAMLDDASASYIMAVYVQKSHVGYAFCDVSTGEFFACQTDADERRRDELITRVSPKEILTNRPDMLESFARARSILLTPVEGREFATAAATKTLCAHFHLLSAAQLDMQDMKDGVCAAGALLSYLQRTQMNDLTHIIALKRYEQSRSLILDATARASLELTKTLHTNSRKGTLFWLLDRAGTPMGSRLIKAWIEQPLRSKDEIEQRLDAVAWLRDQPFARDRLTEAFQSVRDIERLLSKIAYDSVNARDALALKASLEAIPQVVAALADTSAGRLTALRDQLDPMEELVKTLNDAIDPDAPLALKEGGLIRSGYNQELDDYREASKNGKDWLARLESDEREKTGIKNLKIGFNHVFGYYIEVTKSFFALVPDRYIRKQTMVNAERYVTNELKDLESKILGAEESAQKLEYQLFLQIRALLSNSIEALSRISAGLKEIDALLSLAIVAADNDYVRPTINEERRMRIVAGRHPVVERAIGRESFVPNDTDLSADARVMIITGPNMAGKSTYMRQVALITLMAHMGSFVPAESADIPLTDRIFTRIGASDDLYGGQSTFMVEMNELSAILRSATPQSLIILDEIGRGTSTFDGLSIAWSAVEYIADRQKCGAMTLFATHYHELSELEGTLDGVVNYRITATERGGEVIFLRQIVKGGADHSYGISVAALAGLPPELVKRARLIMARLEARDEAEGNLGQNILKKQKNGGDRQISMLDARPMELIEEIRGIDVMALSPIDALNCLFKIVEKVRRI